MKLARLTLIAALLLSNSALAVTVERVNVLAESGVYKPVAVIADGPGAGTYPIGQNGLTRTILFNPALLAAWVSQTAGVELALVQVIVTPEPTSNDPIVTELTEVNCSSDTECTKYDWIAYCDANPNADACGGLTPIDPPPTPVCDSPDPLLCPLAP